MHVVQALVSLDIGGSEMVAIEITEHLVIENYLMFREELAYFRDLGMAFAVDDVGAGYSGLESIAKLKPSYLKIDKALVRDVHANVVNNCYDLFI